MKGLLLLIWLVCQDSNAILVRMPESACEQAGLEITRTIWLFDRSAVSKCVDEEASAFLDYREPWDYCFP
jgi:hypothetical protein